MYRDHQAEIARYARVSAENWRRVAVFAVCTIRMPLDRAAKDVRAAYEGREAPCIFGHKHDALAYLAEHAERLYSACEHACSYSDGPELAAELIEIISEVPGIGIAKAGFIAQMVYGVGGCIDTHNIALYHARPGMLRPRDKLSARSWRLQIAEYVDFCYRLGGPEYLWDRWCEYVATTSEGRGRYDGPEHVSRLHLAAIGA